MCPAPPGPRGPGGAGPSPLPPPTPPNRFERHPFLTGLGLLAATLALGEGALRLADPAPPPAMRIPDEGHFNAAGNRAVAALALSLVRRAGSGEPPGAGGTLE